ncbi:MAG TPA: VOC family protein [Candidatus Angelobacter sp.]|nr:VOC family protein [Candidatus Angelobacter sp.]
MANIEKHPAGSFCWIELVTTDQNAAKQFYTSLFGWSVTDNPMGPGEFYSIFKLRGRDVAAGYTLRKDQLDRGVPVHWSLYIAVDNADQAATKAAQAGGNILMPAFDVMDAGRMAVIHDPTGAAFSIWQPKRTQGIGVAGEDNALCWADLSTPDPDRAAKFYSSLFGWKLEKAEKDSSGYLHIKNGEDYIGGIPPAAHRDPKSHAHWLLYLQVADVEAAVVKAKQLGGKTLMPPKFMEGVGTWAILADPQGAVFSVFKSAR